MPKPTSEIKRFIASRPPGKLFSTAEILCMTSSKHTRSSIDRALARMVASGVLKRITYGVFVTNDMQKETYSSLDIALAKSRNTLVPILSSNFKAHRFPTRMAPNSNTTVFYSLSKGTKFRCNDEYVYIKQMSVRKLQLANSDVGALILYLWQNGSDKTDVSEIANTTACLSRIELEEFIGFTPCMPNWLLTKAKKAIGPKWQKIERELQKRATAVER